MGYEGLINNLRYGMNDDAVAFFIGISRFDYAFKKVGGFFTRPEGNNPDIDWQDRVPAAFPGFYEACADLHERELFTAPPRQFKRVDGVAQFTEQAEALSDTKSLFWALWTLRKNLMHGTKGKLFARDHTLVRDANLVLERAYRYCAASEDEHLKQVSEVMAKMDSYDTEDSRA